MFLGRLKSPLFTKRWGKIPGLEKLKGISNLQFSFTYKIKVNTDTILVKGETERKGKEIKTESKQMKTK